MAQPVLYTLSLLAGVVAGYTAALYRRRRTPPPDDALTTRLLRAGDHRDIAALHACLAARRTEDAVLTAAADTVDAAYARLTRDSQEGGPTP
ncbi:hypothetical protein [Streptomyces sp. NPDC096351]|uniref:hypothetical protein n=1 Tax=Streptomyces sp. NPDC096351 TaxID=3366087 RepID=UPI0037F6DBC5